MATQQEQTITNIQGLVGVKINSQQAAELIGMVDEGRSGDDVRIAFLRAQTAFRYTQEFEEPQPGPGLVKAGVRGLAGGIGFGGDIEQLGATVGRAAISQDPNAYAATPYPAPGAPPYNPTLPTSQETIGFAEQVAGTDLPPSVTGAERVAETVGAGLSTGPAGLVKGGVKGGLKGIAKATGQNVTGGMLAGTGAEAGRAMKGEGAAPLMGSLIATLSGRAVVGQTKRLIINSPWLKPGTEKRRAMREVINLVEENLGGNQTIATATGTGWLASTEKILSRVPGSIRVLHQHGKRISDSAQKRLKQLVGSVRQGETPFEVSGRITNRALSKRVDFVQRNGDRLFRAVSSLIGDIKQRISYRNTRGALRELSDAAGRASKRGAALQKAGRASAENDPQSYAGNLLKELKQFGRMEGDAVASIPYGDLDRLRRTVGAAIRDNIMGDEMQGALKKTYAALSKDIELGATKLGGVRARNAIRKANKFWSDERLITDKVLSPLRKKEGELERIFDAVMDGELKNSTRIRTVFAHLQPAQRKVVAQAWLIRAGKLADDGTINADFDMATFVKNWRASSASMRSEIMAGNPELERNISRLVTSIDKVIDVGSGVAKPNAGDDLLGAAAMWYMLGAAGAGGAAYALSEEGNQGGPTVLAAGAGLLAAMAAPNLTARLMTNNNFVQWAATTATSNAAELSKHMARLNSVVQNSDDAQLIEDIDTFYTYISAIVGDDSEVVEDTSRYRRTRAAP